MAQPEQEPLPDSADLSSEMYELRRLERRIRSLQQVFGQITFDNDYASGLVDWTGAEVLGYPPATTGLSREEWVDLIHPEDRPRLMEHIEVTRHQRVPLVCELRFRHASGHYRWFQVRGIMHFDNYGNPMNLIGVLEDMTERRSQALVAAERDTLARVNDELKEFAYVASHDLQEPLRTITAFVELLNEDHRESLNAEGREYLGFIGEAASRLQRLINDLLTYSRMTSRDEELSTVALKDIVTEALENLFAALDESQARIDVEPLPRVTGEHSRLVLLFQNLIGNAVKFRRKGRPANIRVSATESPTHWQVTVTDDGIGIPPEQHERVFRIFHRLHSIRAYEGTGMGLAICSKIVERHGGQIWVESVPEEGSQFHFTLAKRRASGTR